LYVFDLKMVENNVDYRIGNYCIGTVENDKKNITLVNNVLQRRVHTEDILPEARQFPDLVKGKWYYEAMMEAINSHLYERMEDTYEKWTDIYWPLIEM
jgi:hypothetical protein